MLRGTQIDKKGRTKTSNVMDQSTDFILKEVRSH